MPVRIWTWRSVRTQRLGAKSKAGRFTAFYASAHCSVYRTSIADHNRPPNSLTKRRRYSNNQRRTNCLILEILRSEGQSSQAYRSWIQKRWNSAKSEKGADRAGKHSTFVQPSWRTVSLCWPAADFCWNTMSWLFPLSNAKTERVASHSPELAVSTYNEHTVLFRNSQTYILKC